MNTRLFLFLILLASVGQVAAATFRPGEIILCESPDTLYRVQVGRYQQSYSPGMLQAEWLFGEYVDQTQPSGSVFTSREEYCTQEVKCGIRDTCVGDRVENESNGTGKILYMFADRYGYAYVKWDDDYYATDPNLRKDPWISVYFLEKVTNN